MDRCALFVDAGYLLADGAMAVHGTRHRETVSWDFAGLLQLLGGLARDRTGMPLLRCYWYESTVEGRRAPEHEALADLPGLKLRLGRVRPGRREGVDTEIHRDLMTLARNGALADAVVVAGDEDLAQVVVDAQDLGVRVTVLHVAVDGNWTISRALRQECDDLVEVDSAQLRPYVSLLSGADTGTPALPAPLSNGHGTSGALGAIGALESAVPLSSPPPSSPLTPPPPSTPLTGPPPSSSSSSGSSGSAGGPPPLGSSFSSSTGSFESNYGTGGYDTGLGSSGYGSSSGSGSSSNGSLGNLPPVLGNGSSPSYGNGSSSGYGNGSSPSSTNGIGPVNGSGLGGGSGAHASPLHAAPTPSPTSTGPINPGPLDPGPSAPSSRPGTGPQYLPSSPVPPPTQPPPPAAPTSGPYTGPQQIAPLPSQQASPTLADAVKAAHQEGQDFGESVARDAPALWLEAVLARKPRMPSDLEARLLQGSSLPIDFLLHDEVRHALRRGFWDALERSRR
ncbi:NYN domain-containing protein [Spirillospora sp. NPDC029432]|uniref:NYN domain-containing protein n=1 Tax=Spirillospora sp. NPDC029432 TaxID=3154599 RepID=UPI0034549829